jgi:dTDP-4-dehydrorhamnose 3,5-epimerase
MQVTPTSLAGLYDIALTRHADDRGYFARGWDPEAATKAGLTGHPDQWSFSYNTTRGTLRGMHWQNDPYGETKLVRCIRGRVWDVAVDIRAGSPTRFQWEARELDDQSLNAFYIPPGFAHGFITLTDDAIVQYGLKGPYAPDHAGGARWNDPAFGIDWPMQPSVISDRDRDYPDIV